MIKASPLLRLAPLLPALLVLVANGCQSGGTGANFFGQGGTASVTIKGRSLEAVQKATIEVFEKDEFKLIKSSAMELVFEKPGSNWDKAAYGTWLSPDMTVRAPVKLSQPALGDCRLECHPMLVRGKEDDIFADEFSVSGRRTNHIQELLDQVAQRVNAAGSP